MTKTPNPNDEDHKENICLLCIFGAISRNHLPTYGFI